jgi:glucose-6-phosphate isomerase
MWQIITQHPQDSLTHLFAKDEKRLESLCADVAGIYFDFSKTHLTPALIADFEKIAHTQDLAGKRDTLFSGGIINTTEGRAATHVAERGAGADADVAQAKSLHARMKALVAAIEVGAFGDIKHILHIGIGGSALGPALLMDALGRSHKNCQVHIVANIDGAALAEAFEKCDPATTLIALASKTFTTTETLLNAKSALEWLATHGVEDPLGRVIALTAAPDKALEFGVDETRILPFAASVGGRYSLWSSIGFPAAAALGSDAFSAMLEGAAAMDTHFRTAPFAQNMPALAACVDLYYTQARHCQTRAVFAYDERLRLLPSYLQQLEMESNGKSVSAAGEALSYPSAAITWGGTGTDAQHAVFQLLHQGTRLVPVEFVAVAEPEHDLDDAHHIALLQNCFAQGAALMRGRESADPARAYAGDRPSTTLLLQELNPYSLGALIAFYEHRTFVNAALLGINPFDQFGVELGKEMAKAMEKGGMEFDISTQALLAKAELDA